MVLLCGLAGCGKSQAAAGASAAARHAAAEGGEQPDPLALIGQGPWVWHQSNITLVVGDPGAALEQARAAVEDAGGSIESAAVSTDNRSANLHVASPAERWAQVRGALAGIQGRLRSHSSSRSDRHREVSQALARIRLLRVADAELKTRLRQASDEQLVDALTLQRELNARERQSAFNQLRSYARELGQNRLYVSFVVERQ